jgi:hypothetical protein
MVLNETKRVLHHKENSYQTEEAAAHRMGEIFDSYISDKRLIATI